MRQCVSACGAKAEVCLRFELNYKFIRPRGWKLKIFH